MRTRSITRIRDLSQIKVSTTNTYYKGELTRSTDRYYTPLASRGIRCLKRTTDELHPGPPFILGGPFDSISLDDMGLESSKPIYAKVDINSAWTYELIGNMINTYSPPSPFAIKGESQNWDAIRDLVGGDVSDYGPEAFNKFSPLKPKVSMGQFFAEFSDIPRTLKSTALFFKNLYKRQGGWKRALGPKPLADQWLGANFGWMPFLSDVRKFVRTTIDIQKTLKRVREYNGKWERRGGIVSHTIDSSRVALSTTSILPSSISSGFNPVKRCYVHTDVEQDVWFKAKYKYWIPDISDIKYPPVLIAQLYGMRITPSLLWELMPWSWLIDWFANIGDLLEAADNRSFGQLVTQDAWLMGRTYRTFRIESSLHLKGGIPGTQFLTSKFVTTRKQRIGASPYGFNVLFNELSPWKLSILSALGLSKGRIQWGSL